MKGWIVVTAFVVAWIACAALAQNPGIPPTQVRQIGVYGCPGHPQFQATWPARCPACGTVLSKIRLSADADDNPFSAGSENEEQEQNEGFGNQGYYPSNQYGYQTPYSQRAAVESQGA